MKCIKIFLLIVVWLPFVFLMVNDTKGGVIEHEEYILSHEDEYPEELVALVERNPETADFVYNYQRLLDEEKNTAVYGENIRLTKDDINKEDCLLLQWDERWGAIPYGKSMMALSGCGPTCLSMASLILTGNKGCTPAKVAQYAMDHGYYVQGQGTSWTLFDEGCEAFGMTSEKISVSGKHIKHALDEGGVLIASVKPGDFTSSGHFIVIDGYDEDDLYIKDPNSKENSKRIWECDVVSEQIKCLWRLTKSED